VSTVFAGNPSINIPTGLVGGDISARARRHIWVSKKANWLNLTEIGALTQYREDPA